MTSPGVAPTPCKSPKQATPVINANTPVFRCSSVTPGQVTPVTGVNAQEVLSLQNSKGTASNHSSLSANIQANLNEGNNSFKRMDCYLLLFTSCKYLDKYRPWASSSVTFLPFSPTSGSYSSSLGIQAPTSSPARSHDQHFRNFCNFNNTAILGDASFPSAPA